MQVPVKEKINRNNIVAMSIEDVKKVYELECRCFSIPWTKKAFEEELLKNKMAYYWVIKEEKQILGYGGYWIILDEAHITNIAVDPQRRKRGWGKALVFKMISEMEKEGVSSATLEVRKSNIAAQKLYESMGFSTAGLRKNYYNHPKEDGLIMWTSL